MKLLEKTYKKYRNQHNQINREGDVAIYEIISPESGRVLAYEVFEVVKNMERTIAGVKIGASESTPGNEQWGSIGFTIWQKSAAFAKAGVIQKNIDKRIYNQSKTCNGKNRDIS